MHSLRRVCAHPQDYWNLYITEQGEIEEATTFGSYIQWYSSFFSDAHKASLCARIAELVDDLPEMGSEEQKIIAEKIARYVQSPLSWLYQAFPVKASSSLLLKEEHPIASAVRLHKEGERYYNFPGEAIWWQFFETLRLLFPGTFSSPTEVDLKTWHRVTPKICHRSEKPRITWIGHATVLIQAKGINLLIDPSFNFVSPCFKRHTEPGIALHDLPPIDIIINSHIHTDHRESVETFAPLQPTVLCAKGAENWFEQNGFSNVKGLEWWQRVSTTKDGKTITFTALPAQHGATVAARDLNCYSWMGMMIEIDGYCIYFSGDTGFNEGYFEEIRKKCGKIDLACLPIAPAYEKDMHLDHEDALEAVKILEPTLVLPIHYGAYRTGSVKIEEELNIFLDEARKREMEEKICLLRIGETFIPY